MTKLKMLIATCCLVSVACVADEWNRTDYLPFPVCDAFLENLQSTSTPAKDLACGVAIRPGIAGLAAANWREVAIAEYSTAVREYLHVRLAKKIAYVNGSTTLDEQYEALLQRERNGKARLWAAEFLIANHRLVRPPEGDAPIGSERLIVLKIRMDACSVFADGSTWSQTVLIPVRANDNVPTAALEMEQKFANATTQGSDVFLFDEAAWLFRISSQVHQSNEPSPGAAIYSVRVSEPVIRNVFTWRTACVFERTE